MYYFIYPLLLFGITVCEESAPSITIIWKTKPPYVKYDNPILFDGRPFKIIVEKPYVKHSFSIQCLCDSKKIIDQLLIHDGYQYVAKVSKAEQTMTKTWNCNITQNRSRLPLSWSFQLSPHVRSMKIPGLLRVNDQNITLSTTDLSVSEYDAVGTYYYQKGELAKLTCHRIDGIGNYNYHIFSLNISGTIHETITNPDINLYLKLGHNSSPKHVDCIMKRLFNGGTNIIRLILKPLDGQIGYPQFQVNGLSLTPSKNHSVYNYAFVYEYYPGEELMVSSQLDRNRFTSMSCSLPNAADLIETSELRVNISTHLFVNREASMVCLVLSKNNIISTAKDVQISIKFIEDLMKFSPSIAGIQWSKIIAKFCDNDNRKIVGTFYVSYKSNESLTLNCSSNTTGVKWDYGAEVNTSLLTATTSTAESQFDLATNNYTSSRTFQLPENVSRTTLICKHIWETTKVVLIKQKVPIKPFRQVSSTEKTANSSNNDITFTNYSNFNDEIKSDHTGLFSSNDFIPIIIGVISIIIILLIITLTVFICKRKKSSKTDSDITYENLPRHNEGFMPIPSQWDTNRFKNENIKDVYAKVIPKNKRSKLTEIYTEPLSNKEDSCYATPYNANSDSLYAEIISKEDNEIVPKALRKVAKNQVLPTNDDFAEIGTKIRNRADTDKHKYANVFNSELYANVSSNTDT